MKLARVARSVLAAGAVAGCGYHTAYGGEDAAYRLSVAGAPLAVPYPGALQAALAGARAELARAGALEPGNTAPRLVLEVLRVDEVGSGIAAAPAAAGAIPLARGSAVGVTVHAVVEESAPGGPSRDSGDVRYVQNVAQGGNPVADGAAFEDAVRAAARAAGEGAARRVLGIAEPGVEPM